jgi:hypothetical protein
MFYVVRQAHHERLKIKKFKDPSVRPEPVLSPSKGLSKGERKFFISVFRFDSLQRYDERSGVFPDAPISFRT